LAKIPLFSVKPVGGQTGEGDGIGVAVFFTFFLFTGFLVGFFVVVVLAGFGEALFETAAVALAVGLAFGVGEAA
jgi:hypothetical protein